MRNSTMYTNDPTKGVVEGVLSCRNFTEVLTGNFTDSRSFGDPFNAAEFGTLAGLFLTILFISEQKSTGLTAMVAHFLNAKMISIIGVLTILLISLPVLLTLSLFALLYKALCTVLIKNNDEKYAGLLNSFDVFWSLEDDNSRSIINVFGLIESESPEYLVSKIKEKLERVLIDNDCMSKMFYRRAEKYGFYYWRKYYNFDLDEYVQTVEDITKPVLNENDVEDLLNISSRKPLPYNDTGLFQILIIGKKIVEHGNEANTNYGIIFKIHHSLSDGVALIDLLCQNLADVNKTLFKTKQIMQGQKQDFITEIVDNLYKLSQTPVCFVKGILRKPDKNALHGPALTGDTVFAWTHSDENLLHMMKELKDKIGEVKCTDILVTALSGGLREFLAKKMTNLPEDVAVIIPIRFPRNNCDGSLKLENDFTVSILDVPIEREQHKSNVGKVKRRCDYLRRSSDPLTNYFFLKFAGGVLSNPILRPLLFSRQATLVLSNLPGPETLSICGGNLLKSLVFFVPNKGSTGLGVTALSYGGVLRFAAAADRALVSDAKDLRIILDGMVDEIKRLHGLYC